MFFHVYSCTCNLIKELTHLILWFAFVFLVSRNSSSQRWKTEWVEQGVGYIHNTYSNKLSYIYIYTTRFTCCTSRDTLSSPSPP